jgi:hypothetical protein
MIAPLRSDTQWDDEAAHQEGPDRHSREHVPADHSPFEPLLQHFAELRHFVAHYWMVQKDAAKAKARRAIIWAALGVVAALVAFALLVAAAALTLVGLADALGVLFGDRFWAGKLAVGLGIIFLSLGGLALALFLWARSARQTTVKQYEHRHNQQRAQFGQDVQQRAAAFRQPVEADSRRSSERHQPE